MFVLRKRIKELTNQIFINFEVYQIQEDFLIFLRTNHLEIICINISDCKIDDDKNCINLNLHMKMLHYTYLNK